MRAVRRRHPSVATAIFANIAEPGEVDVRGPDQITLGSGVSQNDRMAFSGSVRLPHLGSFACRPLSARPNGPHEYG